MHLYFHVISWRTFRNYAVNTCIQHDDTLRMQHQKPTNIVLTNYTVLCGLYETA